MTQAVSALTADEVTDLRDRIYAEGVVGLKGAFPVEWVDQLRNDVDRAFVETGPVRTVPSAGAESLLHRNPS